MRYVTEIDILGKKMTELKEVLTINISFLLYEVIQKISNPDFSLHFIICLFNFIQKQTFCVNEKTASFFLQ